MIITISHENRMPRQLRTAVRSIKDVIEQQINHRTKTTTFSKQNDEFTQLPFQPRRSFALPNHVPSWYAGHMYRAMRSLPVLLSRQPPPLIIETRDARLPISSVNPAFEEMFHSMKGIVNKTSGNAEGQSSGQQQQQKGSISDLREWRKRRLIVYNKADLIDARLHAPIRSAFERFEGHDVMFIDSRKDVDVKRVMKWVQMRAATLAKSEGAVNEEIEKEKGKSKEALGSSNQGLVPRSARKQNLTGAFRHTSTPEDGVRLVILGMPNVGKSSLLNALRRVGTGAGKAASTAPEPGHTRKLTGTVRITKKQPNKEQEDAEGKGSGLTQLERKQKDDPAIYVYDTPGVMVPYLGNGPKGAEKGVKLAVAAGIKSSLFDAIGLADYLLYRLNLQWAWRWNRWKRTQSTDPEPLPAYLTGLPMGKVAVTISENDSNTFGPTNDVQTLLERLSLRSPGTLSKNGVRDLDAAANFMLERWRNGKLGSGELDCECFEISPSLAQEQQQEKWTEAGVDAKIESIVENHFASMKSARKQGAANSFRPVQGADRASRRKMEKIRWTDLRDQHNAAKSKDDLNQNSTFLSKRQIKARQRAIEDVIRDNRLREKGVKVAGLLTSNQRRAGGKPGQKRIVGTIGRRR